MSNLIQHPYQDLQTHPFKNMFDKFTHFLENGNMYSHIHVNLTEDDRAYYISADLPGVKESDINIELDQERLTISAKREDLHKDQKYICICLLFIQLMRYIEDTNSTLVMIGYNSSLNHK